MDTLTQHSSLKLSKRYPMSEFPASPLILVLKQLEIEMREGEEHLCRKDDISFEGFSFVLYLIHANMFVD